MPGKWTKRGIEDSHGHLIADLDGTIVCTKRKEREEVPVGRMVLERSNCIEPPFRKGSKAEELVAGDRLLQELSQRFENSQGVFKHALSSVEACKLKIMKRFRTIVHEKGLSAPDAKTLNSGKRFACPSHPDSRFLWVQNGRYETNTRPDILRYQRSCFECSLPPHFRETHVGPPETKESTWAYECPYCGIVPGMCVTETSGAYSSCENYYCKLCGNFLGQYVYDQGR